MSFSEMKAFSQDPEKNSRITLLPLPRCLTAVSHNPTVPCSWVYIAHIKAGCCSMCKHIGQFVTKTHERQTQIYGLKLPGTIPVRHNDKLCCYFGRKKATSNIICVAPVNIVTCFAVGSGMSISFLNGSNFVWRIQQSDLCVCVLS